jgi:hypothetical protein
MYILSKYSTCSHKDKVKLLYYAEKLPAGEVCCVLNCQIILHGKYNMHQLHDAHVGVGIMQTHSISMKGVCHLPFVKGQQRMCAICPFQEGSGL